VAGLISRTIATRESELRERREQTAAAENAERISRRLLASMRTIFGF
jgi:hypothetical protein